MASPGGVRLEEMENNLLRLTTIEAALVASSPLELNTLQAEIEAITYQAPSSKSIRSNFTAAIETDMICSIVDPDTVASSLGKFKHSKARVPLASRSLMAPVNISDNSSDDDLIVVEPEPSHDPGIFQSPHTFPAERLYDDSPLFHQHRIFADPRDPQVLADIVSKDQRDPQFLQLSEWKNVLEQEYQQNILSLDQNESIFQDVAVVSQYFGPSYCNVSKTHQLDDHFVFLSKAQTLNNSLAVRPIETQTGSTSNAHSRFEMMLYTSEDILSEHDIRIKRLEDLISVLNTVENVLKMNKLPKKQKLRPTLIPDCDTSKSSTEESYSPGTSSRSSEMSETTTHVVKARQRSSLNVERKLRGRVSTAPPLQFNSDQITSQMKRYITSDFSTEVFRIFDRLSKSLHSAPTAQIRRIVHAGFSSVFSVPINDRTISQFISLVSSCTQTILPPLFSIMRTILHAYNVQKAQSEQVHLALIRKYAEQAIQDNCDIVESHRGGRYYVPLRQWNESRSLEGICEWPHPLPIGWTVAEGSGLPRLFRRTKLVWCLSTQHHPPSHILPPLHLQRLFIRRSSALPSPSTTATSATHSFQDSPMKMAHTFPPLNLATLPLHGWAASLVLKCFECIPSTSPTDILNLSGLLESASLTTLSASSSFFDSHWDVRLLFFLMIRSASIIQHLR
ncbi:hypothetical protein BLNAU_15025 [Blattamonas nauphoetae]|uniref:Uncharacterized protein n=1 Tax=Blattamonas nauphoetae TaxID=2049346 RepID=A0ABQ9XII3_9EUKA|nr:hypothetical protein BLNAU_15025 [Blattamonas nauphoetae]